MVTPLKVTGDDAADELINSDPLALLLGMMLDQQINMEKAFRGPSVIVERTGRPLDAGYLAALDPEEMATIFSLKPAIHRFPGSMAKRAQDLCQHVVDNYDGDAERIWTEATSGRNLVVRLGEVPGYGPEKAKIFVAILAKRFDVQPYGWKAAAGAFSDNKPRSVADIDSIDRLKEVRDHKKALKAKGKNKQGQKI